jgi:hypothetical protein
MTTEKDLLLFNEWSRERIARGVKFCTSRSRPYSNDPRVKFIIPLKLLYVKLFLFQTEGAGSQEEFEHI